MSFTFSSRFREAAAAINELPVEKLPLLLNRIIEKLHLRDERLFTAAEEEKLQNLFGFNQASLMLILNSCCYIFEQAAFSSTGPEPLYELLLEAGFDASHGKCIGRFWAEEAGGFVNKLKARTLGAPALLSTDYHLNIIMADSNLNNLCEPTALFELSVSSDNNNISVPPSMPNSTESASTHLQGGVEKIALEFSHDELYSFFNQLEKIQSQIDQLSTK